MQPMYLVSWAVKFNCKALKTAPEMHTFSTPESVETGKVSVSLLKHVIKNANATGVKKNPKQQAENCIEWRLMYNANYF